MPLNPAARAAIDELASSGVTDLTPEEVLAVHDAAEALMAAGKESEDGTVCEEPPVECGGLVLHPVTLCAADYILLATRGRIDDSRLWYVVTALVHAREPSVLAALDTRLKRWSEARRIHRQCAATRKEVEAAVLSLLGGDRVDAETSARAAAAEIAAYVEPDDPALARFIREKCARHFVRFGPEVEIRHVAQGIEKRPAADVGYWHGLAAELAALTGTDAAYWLASSRRLVLRCYRNAQRLALAWGGMFAPDGGGASGKGGGGERVEVAPAVVEAIRALQAVKARIRKRREEPARTADTEEPENG